MRVAQRQDGAAPRPAAAVHVCSLDRVWDTVMRERPSHLITLLHNDAILPTPSLIDTTNHLRLSLHDISVPQHGMVHPGSEHVDRILAFIERWDRTAPLLIHCLAGISRSTATAFIATCALNPKANETVIARRIRDLSPTASPNMLLVELADERLGRNGRMIEAIEAIGRGEPAMEGWPFAMPSHWPAAGE
jgi:predicted protein tyrosine phosphatase